MKIHLLWIGAVVVALGAGFLTGRQFPAHHYEKYGETRFLLDTSTGALCDPVPPPNRMRKNSAAAVSPLAYPVWTLAREQLNSK